MRLQKLHDNLQQDYENMAKEKDAQKDVEKQLRTEVKKLKTMSLSLDEDQEKLFRAKEAIGKLEFFKCEWEKVKGLRYFAGVLKVAHKCVCGEGGKCVWRWGGTMG